MTESNQKDYFNNVYKLLIEEKDFKIICKNREIIETNTIFLKLHGTFFKTLFENKHWKENNNKQVELNYSKKTLDAYLNWIYSSRELKFEDHSIELYFEMIQFLDYIGAKELFSFLMKDLETYILKVKDIKDLIYVLTHLENNDIFSKLIQTIFRRVCHLLKIGSICTKNPNKSSGCCYHNYKINRESLGPNYTWCIFFNEEEIKNKIMKFNFDHCCLHSSDVFTKNFIDFDELNNLMPETFKYDFLKIFWNEMHKTV